MAIIGGSPALATGTQTYSGNQGQSGSGSYSASNQFTPGQQALQGQAGSSLLGFLSGNQQVPAYMTAPPQVFDAYNSAFTKYVEPGVAAQFGAGSPQIGAQRSYGNQQLAAQLYQSGITNWLNGLGMAGNLGFTPTGVNANNSFQGASNVNATQTQGQSLLSMLLGMLGG